MYSTLVLENHDVNTAKLNNGDFIFVGLHFPLGVGVGRYLVK